MAANDRDVVGDRPRTRPPSSAEISKVTNEAKGIMSVATAFLTQPFIVARTLMQVGYEPIEPEYGVSLFLRKPGYYYPNTYKYLWHLRKIEGSTALFKGIAPKILNVFIGQSIEQSVDQSFRSLVPYNGEDKKEPQHKKGIAGCAYEMAAECMSKSALVIITQPLHVVMVRMICTLINKDEVYSGVMASIKEIYNTEGLSGFFKGLVPRWASEIATIVMTGTVMYGVYRVIENAMVDESMSSSPNYHALVQFFVYGLVYKYQLTSTVTAASCQGLHIGLPAYTGWRSCYADLQLHRQLTRGQNMFYREALSM